jgi:cysteinyl-tRNA synthetase
MSAKAEIKLTNTLSGKKEVFEPRGGAEAIVKIYLCGPTVYGFAHVGNARTALMGDLVHKILKLAGYQVDFSRNITDIDDKIIKVANDQSKNWSQVAKLFEDAYLKDMADLAVTPPSRSPHATEHVKDILAMIEGLIKQGYAYPAETPFGRDVYFRVKKFQTYGKLSRKNTDDLMSGARIEVGEAKEDPLDFALWKSAKPGEPSWESPWGAGRPGWHIECSAMIHALFHDEIDIHMGGLDLIFPHHENEIAQSEAYSSKSLAKYWIHGGLLTFGKEKMSKSLGNIVLTKDFIESFGAETYRMMCLQNHYRGPMDFSDEVILRSESLLERLYSAKGRVVDSASAPDVSHPELSNIEEQMRTALFDDFNAAKATGVALKGLRLCFKEDKPELWKLWGKQTLIIFNSVFEILKSDPRTTCHAMRARRLKRVGISEQKAGEIEKRLEDREQFRKNKDFAASDRLRAEIESEGIVVMDGPDGACWTVRV